MLWPHSMVYVETLGFRLDFAFESKFRYVHDSFIQMKTKTVTNNHTESNTSSLIYFYMKLWQPTTMSRQAVKEYGTGCDS